MDTLSCVDVCRERIVNRPSSHGSTRDQHSTEGRLRVNGQGAWKGRWIREISGPAAGFPEKGSDGRKTGAF